MHDAVVIRRSLVPNLKTELFYLLEPISFKIATINSLRCRVDSDGKAHGFPGLAE